ncbi:MAG: hypothetical protein R3B74_14935 [Nitrospirales bacterium]|nr:hypothetical protein [Nitrospirales bacterium]
MAMPDNSQAISGKVGDIENAGGKVCHGFLGDDDGIQHPAPKRVDMNSGPGQCSREMPDLTLPSNHSDNSAPNHDLMHRTLAVTRPDEYP